MYIVRFVRKDGMPDEEYNYLQYEEAQNHLLGFVNDDSNIYSEIRIEGENTILAKIIPNYSLPLGRWARFRLEYLKGKNPELYIKMSTNDSLLPYLIELDKTVQTEYENYKISIQNCKAVELSEEMQSAIAEEIILESKIYV